MTEIEAVRLELSTFSTGQPKAVQGAAKFLDGWLAAAMDPQSPGANEMIGALYGHQGVNILACTARAVETLRKAMRRC